MLRHHFETKKALGTKLKSAQQGIILLPILIVWQNNVDHQRLYSHGLVTHYA